jgi:hypothetical protein
MESAERQYTPDEMSKSFRGYDLGTLIVRVEMDGSSGKDADLPFSHSCQLHFGDYQFNSSSRINLQGKSCRGSSEEHY